MRLAARIAGCASRLSITRGAIPEQRPFLGFLQERKKGLSRRCVNAYTLGLGAHESHHAFRQPRSIDTTHDFCAGSARTGDGGL